MAANAAMLSDDFAVTKKLSDMNSMWDIVRKILVLSAIGTFKKKWFKSFNCVFTKVFSKFHKLELLVFKLVKASHELSSDNFKQLLELILEPKPVRSKVDEIMEDWTRKCVVVSDISNDWAQQYLSLSYVFDEAFSNVMGLIDFDEMSIVISNLPDRKAAGLSGISNELWKHCDKSVLDMLLVLLNFCLAHESVPGPWKEAWVSMIPKPYE
ncbi:hypothetical protein G9A89_023295 [Geosiphon pyriformis]|nr:hypothetical protein G9A89_023295 [Geosiphon pyriformis]